MFRYFKIVLTIILAATLGSCTDSMEMPENILLPGSPGTLTIRFQSTNLTRSTASDDSENKISTLVVGLYDYYGNNDEPAVRFVNLGTVDKLNKHEFTMALDDETITTLFGDINNAKCRIFAVANLPVDQTFPREKPTINELKKLNISSQFNTSKVQPSFVMCGEGEVTYTAPAMSGIKGKAEGSVAMVRAAAKINVNLAVPDTIHVQAGPEVDNFEIWAPEKGAIFALINNGVKKAVVAPEQSDGNPWRPADPADYYYSTLGTNERKISYDDKVPDDNKYKYVMDVPFYTYPNAWTESDLETTKTTLTLTVPWRKMRVNESGELVGEGSWQTYYYQIPVTPVTLPLLLRNHSYTVNMTVGMLGSPTPETEEVVDGLSYQIVPWGQKDVAVDIQDFRYLVVDPNIITVENEDEIIIPFYSSHPVDISDVTMTFQRFNFFSGTQGEVSTFTIPEDVLDKSTAIVDGKETKMVEWDILTDPNTNQKSLVVRHALEIWYAYNENEKLMNLIGKRKPANPTEANLKSYVDNYVTDSISSFKRPTNPEPAYSSYKFTLKLSHKDNNSYNQSIEITQYPGMYIRPINNPGGSYNVYVNTGGLLFPNYQVVERNYGNAFVNPTLDTYNNIPYWTNSSTLGGLLEITSPSSNQNPNMYQINITQLSLINEDNEDEEDYYIIGDPRSHNINNDLSETGDLSGTGSSAIAGNWCVQAGALYDGSATNKRRLKYYYPTDETDINLMRVAPKFRIASSYAEMSAVSRENCRRRAATYQEQNCPAGRWRLPTYGEMKFIVWLAGTKKIPYLFDRGGTYMTAQGPYTVASDGSGDLKEYTGSSTSFYTRPVYDDWYWEQFDNEYVVTPGIFTFGDMPVIFN